MKTKGFTLVELLGVIVILAVIFVTISMSVTKLTITSKTTIYQKQINTILKAAYDFTLKNLNYLPNDTNINYVTLGQLKYEGLVEPYIINPKNNKKIPDNLVISIKKVGTDYKSDDYSMLNGNYLYTVEMVKLNDKEIEKKSPKIKLTYSATGQELTQDPNNNYILFVNVNDEVPHINAVAKSYSNQTISKKTTQYITHKDALVSWINTSIPSIYTINYSVVDNEGYASFITLSVVIVDNIFPTITFPAETIISKYVTKFDLLKDVYCQDNSGYCNIEYTDTIDYGVPGMYVITYTVKDPTGNTTIRKRTIEIE